jgi:hypothetical protein
MALQGAKAHGRKEFMGLAAQQNSISPFAPKKLCRAMSQDRAFLTTNFCVGVARSFRQRMKGSN